MKVTIIGAGNMGRGIGTRAVAGGHDVEILDRDPAEAQKLAEELGGSAVALEPGAPFGGEIVVFALYYPGIKDAVREYADQLAGKVVVDITNPVDTQTWDRLATAPGSSSAEEVAQLVPEGTPVVKAFNTTFAGTLVPGEAGGQQLDVLIAGDDQAAKQKVSRLAADGGLRPLDVGPLSRAQQLEQLGFLHISTRSRSASASAVRSSCIPSELPIRHTTQIGVPSPPAGLRRPRAKHKPDHERPRAGYVALLDPQGLRGFRGRRDPRVLWGTQIRSSCKSRDLAADAD